MPIKIHVPKYKINSKTSTATLKKKPKKRVSRKVKGY